MREIEYPIRLILYQLITVIVVFFYFCCLQIPVLIFISTTFLFLQFLKKLACQVNLGFLRY